jgi:hypothetical protein
MQQPDHARGAVAVLRVTGRLGSLQQRGADAGQAGVEAWLEGGVEPREQVVRAAACLGEVLGRSRRTVQVEQEQDDAG